MKTFQTFAGNFWRAILIAIPIALIFLLGCKRQGFETFLTFTSHDTAYYQRFASACDQILSYGSTNLTNGIAIRMEDNSVEYQLKIRGNESWIPKAVRDIHPTEFRVYTNVLIIMVGVGRMGGYGVSWKPDDGDPSQWRLRASGEGAVRNLLLERRNSSKRQDK